MTTSNSAFDFHLNRPGALIAAIPAVLGFVPEKSLVLVTVIAGEMGAVMRVDLSESLTDGLDHLADMAPQGLRMRSSQWSLTRTGSIARCVSIPTAR